MATWSGLTRAPDDEGGTSGHHCYNEREDRDALARELSIVALERRAKFKNIFRIDPQRSSHNHRRGAAIEQ